MIKGFISKLLTSLRFRLLVLVMVACAPLVGFAIYSAWAGRRAELAAWQERSQRVEQLVKQEEEEVIGESRQLLLAIAESSAVRTSNRRGSIICE